MEYIAMRDGILREKCGAGEIRTHDRRVSPILKCPALRNGG